MEISSALHFRPFFSRHDSFSASPSLITVFRLFGFRCFNVSFFKTESVFPNTLFDTYTALPSSASPYIPVHRYTLYLATISYIIIIHPIAAL